MSFFTFWSACFEFFRLSWKTYQCDPCETRKIYFDVLHSQVHVLNSLDSATGNQTYKHFYLLFVILILFDLYSTIVFWIYYSICSLLSSYLYYDIGAPKKCRNIYKLNKYKNKINTTINLLLSLKKMYLNRQHWAFEIFQANISFIHYYVVKTLKVRLPKRCFAYYYVTLQNSRVSDETIFCAHISPTKSFKFSALRSLTYLWMIFFHEFPFLHYLLYL